MWQTRVALGVNGLQAFRAAQRGGGRSWCRALLISCGLAVVFLTAPSPLDACPFCSAVSQTFSEEMESMDIVCLVRLEGEPATPPTGPPGATELPETRFVVVDVLKGSEWVEPQAVIKALYFGAGGNDKVFLITGANPPSTMWSTPLTLTPAAVDYIRKLPSLPADASRLQFFQEFLEHEDPMLAADAYDEFAKTPYAGVIALKDKMHRERLLQWIQDPEMPATRKRLYYTMLGICAQPQDVQVLERLMRASDRKLRAGLDALIACYLLLTKEEGLPLVEELFLKNTEAEYADTYAAIMALRFHGTEVDVLPKQDLLRAMRHMLERPELADLVIPDLARWEDWDAMPRLVELFKQADEKSSWVRVPVINYLRACPLPEAERWIEQLSELDPDAVRRAQTFFPFGGSSPNQASRAETDQDQSAEDDSEVESNGGEAEQPPAAQPLPDANQDVRAPAAAPSATSVSAVLQQQPTLSLSDRLVRASVPILVVAVLALTMRSVLFGLA